MARIRTIKPEFCTSADSGALSRDARLFFLQLLTECDDEGRVLWIPRRLCGVLYPHDDDVTAAMLSGWADECVSRGMVILYETTAGKALQVANWSKHQKISHPTASKIAPPPGYSCKPPEDSGDIPEEYRKSPEPLRPEQGKERKGKEQGKSAADAAELFVLPDWLSPEAWAGFEEMRLKLKKPMTDRAKRLVIKKLSDLRAAGHNPNAILDNSTTNGWQDVYAPRQDGKPVAAAPVEKGTPIGNLTL